MLSDTIRYDTINSEMVVKRLLKSNLLHIIIHCVWDVITRASVCLLYIFHIKNSLNAWLDYYLAALVILQWTWRNKINNCVVVLIYKVNNIMKSAKRKITNHYNWSLLCLTYLTFLAHSIPLVYDSWMFGLNDEQFLFSSLIDNSRLFKYTK